jgi:DNA-directed RNA polymerase specialized sigma24 family protein
MVRASARRCLGPFAHWSDDITQTVFVTLARKAARLATPAFQPGPWLYRQTVRQTLNLVRAESRRTRRETLVHHAMNASPAQPTAPGPPPHLDQALARLRAADREAIVMRYVEGRDLSSVAHALGVSEEAARKRISRALETLRQKLSRHSTKVTSLLLAAWLATPETGAASGPPIQTLWSKIEAGLPASRGATGQGSWSSVGWGLACGCALSAIMVVPGLLPGTGTTTGEAALPGAAPAAAERLRAEHLAASRSLDDVLEALRKTAHFPKNEITKLTRQGIVNRAAPSQWPTLAARAVKRWQDEELEGALGSLLITWGKQSPEAALRFVKEHGLGERIFGVDGIMGWEWSLYTDWTSRDLTAASDWLLSEICEPWLRSSTLSGSSGPEMADFTLHALTRLDPARAIAWAERLPVGPIRKAALEGLANDDEMSDSNHHWTLADHDRMARMLWGAREGPLGTEVLERFIAAWGRRRKEEVPAWMTTITDPGLKQSALLGWLRVERHEIPSGPSSHGWEFIKERAVRADACLAAAGAEPPGPMIQRIVKAWPSSGVKELTAWLEALPPSLNVDPVWQLAARRCAGARQFDLALRCTAMVSDETDRRLAMDQFSKQQESWEAGQQRARSHLAPLLSAPPAKTTEGGRP